MSWKIYQISMLGHKKLWCSEWQMYSHKTWRKKYYKETLNRPCHLPYIYMFMHLSTFRFISYYVDVFFEILYEVEIYIIWIFYQPFTLCANKSDPTSTQRLIARFRCVTALSVYEYTVQYTIDKSNDLHMKPWTWCRGKSLIFLGFVSQTYDWNCRVVVIVCVQTVYC